MENFKEQIIEDIEHIKKEYLSLDKNLTKNEYAFNYWVLSKLYNVDEEYIPDSIVEYQDKGIDCWVDYEESKELYIIQNKFYDENTPVKRGDISDFLSSPISILNNNNYKKCPELQNVFNKAKNDSEYKILFHFYVTNNKKNKDCVDIISEFNKKNYDLEAQIRANIFYLQDIYEQYYGSNFKENIKFEFTIHTINKGTILKILPEQYNLEGMSEAYYIMTPVVELYEMNRHANKCNYQLFEENIREYLGKNTINNGIIRTLKSKNDRKNFFYYNNGVTIICDSTEKSTSGGYTVTMRQPQIVNGCQTVNTIFEVLKDYSEVELKNEFNNVYVMTKVLIFNKDIEKKKPNFYKDIVKFTNRQNSIKDDAFGAINHLFLNFQRGLRDRGFLLLVKPSDQYQFKEEFKNKKELNTLLLKAREYCKNIEVDVQSITDLFIPLDKLLQLYLALKIDGFEAYKKKSLVLNPTSDIYKNHSLYIQDWLSFDSMIKLYLLFKRAEKDRKNSQDNRTPIPYYLIGFIGYFIKDKNKISLNRAIELLFNLDKSSLEKVYEYFKSLTNLYKTKYPADYNYMIKKHIDEVLLEEQIETINQIMHPPELESYINKINS